MTSLPVFRQTFGYSTLEKVMIRIELVTKRETGQMLYNSCRGHPSADEELNFDQERKSVSSEVNYGIRFNNMEECRKFVIQLSEEVCKRLEDISPHLMARALTVKLMVRAECEKGKETAKFMGHGICDSHSKSSNFASPTNDSRVITKEVLSVLNRFAQSFFFTWALTFLIK